MYKQTQKNIRSMATVPFLLISMVSWIVVRIAVVIAAIFLIPEKYIFNVNHQLELHIPYVLRIWGNFDGVNYLRVAMHGYTQAELGFFPLFPVLIAFVSDSTLIPLFYTALLINLISLFACLYIISRLIKIDAVAVPLWFVILTIFIYPTSYYFGAIYNDALFFFLASLCIYLARKKMWFIAATVGFFASLTRLNGIGLMLFLVVEWFSQQEKIGTWVPRGLTRSSTLIHFIKKYWYLPVLVMLGFLTYLLFIHLRFSSWQMLFVSMRQWGQSRATFPLQVLARYARFLYLSSWHTFAYWIAVLELLSVFLYIYIMIISYKAIRFSYWLLMLISFILPSITGTFQGMPRYSLHMYPFFIALSSYLYGLSTKKRIIILLTFFILQCVLLMFYSRGYFIS